MAKSIKTLLADSSTNHISVQDIDIKIIHASKTNPRTTFDNDKIEDLAKSMAIHGLIQPITLRPHAKKTGEFEIVAGERRFRAAKQLKWTTMPSQVLQLDDEAMLEIQIIENLQREDVSPIDEAHAFASLLKKENIDWLASRINKPKKYVSDRLKLNDLCQEAQQYVSDNVLPIGHAMVISKLSFADQQACLEKCIDYLYRKDENLEYCKLPLEELKEYIADNIMLVFDKVSFDTEDETLYPEAGACSKCPKRTCNSNLLFDDITKEDRCTDAACFNEKMNLHVAREKQKAKESYGKVLSGEKSVYTNSSEIKVQGITMKFSETPTKNTVPVVITKTDRFNKNITGTTVYVNEKLLNGKKAEKEERKSSGGGSGINARETWQQQQKRELVENWDYISSVVNQKAAHPDVVRVAIYSMLNSLDDLVFFSIGATLGLIDGLNTPEQVFEYCYNTFEDLDYTEQTEIRKKLVDRIMEPIPTMELLCSMVYMIKLWDDDIDYKSDEDIDLSKKEIMELLKIKPTKKK